MFVHKATQTQRNVLSLNFFFFKSVVPHSYCNIVSEKQVQYERLGTNPIIKKGLEEKEISEKASYPSALAL